MTMMEHSPDSKAIHQRSAQTSEQVHPSLLTIDYALYEKYLSESDLSVTEKQEFLDALWSVIVAFVDLGFGVHPLQQAGAHTNGVDELTEPCGQELDLTSLMASDVISSVKGISQYQFSKAVKRKRAAPRRGRRYEPS